MIGDLAVASSCSCYRATRDLLIKAYLGMGLWHLHDQARESNTPKMAGRTLTQRRNQNAADTTEELHELWRDLPGTSRLGISRD